MTEIKNVIQKTVNKDATENKQATIKTADKKQPQQARQESTTIKPLNKPLQDLGRCLVIGGAGMLGVEIACQLRKENHYVRVFDLENVELDGVESIIGDIRNKDDVEKACKGIDTIFQTAAAVWKPGTPAQTYDDVNVVGNQNVIDACIKLGIPRFIYTSTLDVVVDGKKPIKYADESLPYPEKMPKDHYSRTKILAEKATINSNNGQSLLTVSLRPVGMYGPRDKYHIANIIQAAKSKNNIKLGNGAAKFSHVYSENAAHAHILAAKHLYPGSPVAGECYFVADHQPAENLFTFMEPFLKALGLSPPKISIPYRVAYSLAWITEKIAPNSNFNRFAVIQTCIDHTFVSDKAKRDFGYEPMVSKEEAFEKTVQWFKNNY